MTLILTYVIEVMTPNDFQKVLALYIFSIYIFIRKYYYTLIERKVVYNYKLTIVW